MLTWVVLTVVLLLPASGGYYHNKDVDRVHLLLERLKQYDLIKNPGGENVEDRVTLEERGKPWDKVETIEYGPKEDVDNDADTEDLPPEQSLDDESLFEDLEKFLNPEKYKIASWMTRINEELRDWNHRLAVSSWTYETNVTNANAEKKKDVELKMAIWARGAVKKARNYLSSGVDLDPELTRMLKLTAQSVTSDDHEKQRKIEDLLNKLSMLYGQTTVEKGGKSYHVEPELENVLAKSRDYDEILWAWWSWRNATGAKMLPLYEKLVKLQTETARENGYRDYGNYWRVNGFEQDDIGDEAEKLMREMKPLYQHVHAYVRRRLIQKYPQANVSPNGPIPAHLLGNMWAQQWTNILDLVKPFPSAPTAEVTSEMEAQGYDAERMFRTAESFYTSIGLEPMTDNFWNHSLIRLPTDGRTVQCHGSAEEMHDEKHKDFRIKMCTRVTQEDLQTVHHEMGHVEYFMQYRHLPEVFHSGANTAFHEAVGDTIALSVMTPGHLKTIGLLKEESLTEHQAYQRDMNFLMQMALEKVVFLPYALALDKWRWDVFSGAITRQEYNRRWWHYRLKYQGLKPPVPRSGEDFDPGAKYHVACNVPYIRYFFSFIGQFQFQRALCQEKGHVGPDHHCDIYRSKAAGNKLKSMLSLGQSKPWPIAMEILTGERKFNTRAIREYFRPLEAWLIEQNQNEAVGWESPED